MITIFSKTNSIANHFLAELRHIDIQSDRMRFRKNLERLGEIFAYEISKKMTYTSEEIVTPLGVATVPLLKEQPVLATILRAGLPMHQGFMNYFDRADSAYIAAYRKNKKNSEFEIKVEYFSTPDMANRIVIVSDPMLATGKSMVIVCKELMARFDIKELHLVSIIASIEGIEHVRAHLPKANLWLGAVDEELTSKAYIVPGLGDAGDLCFGEKL
ncbi:uracil phosphoribosyltransferase [Solitalea canadensis]|uniref:Uracil phosphoribosyltransferase n=1 Tax=Solitalea canadensis (strain ATCC 29591 / DSM 3403 / JCM 21819 / LMG 8368 / NBRC 15130 / NCIMB 12057 / USAM 9D) TaxID=929556 RepID=H8KL69_SOLCM|nr:uracil phosphoribosyltransferase [Solitalea canadensis]AFD09152.1 uracil phosphoribosyltransferase [Solitalea canadensis DSM 3403]